MEFSKLLDKKPEDIVKPPLAPIGTYLMAVSKVPTQLERGEWKIVEFTFKALEAMEDVDEDDLKEFGKVTGILARRAFMFSDDEEGNAKTEYQLKRFLDEHLGVEDYGTLGEGLAKSVNHQCLVSIHHVPDKNNAGEFHANVKSTAPAE